ncbi:MAG: dockerin type I repeat-containing protein, partial [Verrucomicrobiota bacterium]|nr:dockerin type I repeat-containing protein [Verrucomicrobiota bacterium]
EVNNGSATTGVATLRFPGADIRAISNAIVKVIGQGASIRDFLGNNALRNLNSIQGATFSSSGIQTYTPPGGTFANSGSTHIIESGSIITVQGNLTVSKTGLTLVSGPTDSSNTALIVQGNMLIDGSVMDLGGQPGVNTQYHSQLQVMNGIQFRGGYLTGTGTTFADIGMIQGSVFSPGHSAGQLTIEGAVNFDPTTTLMFQIGGLTAGAQYDQLVHAGTSACSLGGTLDLSLIDGFANSILHSDTFDIVTSDNLLTGAFQNVTSGGRLATSDELGSFKVTYANQKAVTLSDYQAVPTLVGVVARETHGGQGTFDLPLNLSGDPTVESRGFNTHHLVFTFNNDVVSGDVSVSAPAGGGVSGSPTFAGNTMSVTLTGVANAQKLTIFVSGLTDQYAQVLPDTSLDMYVLLGDINGDRSVNSADATITRNRSGEATTAANFRADVNLDGTINSADATVVRNNSGSGLPAGTDARTR